MFTDCFILSSYQYEAISGPTVTYDKLEIIQTAININETENVLPELLLNDALCAVRTVNSVIASKIVIKIGNYQAAGRH